MTETDNTYLSTYHIGGRYDADGLKGEIDGLYGRMPPELKRLVRKIMDAPNYDFGAMELLDFFEMDWRLDQDKPNG